MAGYGQRRTEHRKRPIRRCGKPTRSRGNRAAAATIARLMLCADPYAKKTAQNITEACRVILARFDKESVTENENEEEVC